MGYPLKKTDICNANYESELIEIASKSVTTMTPRFITGV